VARELSIPLWDIDSVPMQYQHLAYACFMAERNAKQEFEVSLVRAKRQQELPL